MRTTALIPLALIVFLLHSCITTKTYSANDTVVLDASMRTYIQTKDGQKIQGKSVSLPSAFVLTKNYIKLDGKKYMDSDLVAYQDKNAYYKLLSRSFGDVWVKQIRRGKINLYTYETVPDKRYGGGTNTEYHDHFVFEKECDGVPLAELSLPDIAKILKDNKKAYDVFTAQFGTEEKKFFPKQLDKHPKVIMEAVDIYNQNS